MARKIQNRIQLREEAEAAERIAEAAPEKKKKEKATPVKRKSRAKTVKEVRLKAFWGVFNQSLRRVAVFEFDKRADADIKAEALGKSQKTPHFVQLVKEVIEQ